MKRLERWFKNWRARRRLRKLALQIVSDPAPGLDALIKAQGIINALQGRQPVCMHCYEPFTFKERSFSERFHLRAILVINDREPDPMLCDGCFDKAVGVYNRQWTNVGTNNSAPTNLALKHLH